MRKNNNLLKIKYFAFAFVFLIFLLNQIDVVVNGQGDIRNYRNLIEIKFINSQLTEPFLKFLIIILNYFTSSTSIILLIINSLNFILILLISQLFVKKDNQKEILLILMMGLSVALLSSVQTSMRQGLGYIFFFYFIYSLKLNYKLIQSILFLLLAALCHNIFLIIGSILIVLKFLNISKNLFRVFIFFIILYLFSILFMNEILALVQDLFLRQTYLEYKPQREYLTGLRFDFIASIIVMIVFIIFAKRFNFKNFDNEDKLYLNLLMSSIIAGVIFKDLPYIDRFFYVSWIFFPIIFAKYTEKNLLILLSIFFISINYFYKPSRYEFDLVINFL